MSIADKLAKVAENTPMVYAAGYSEGKADGFSEGKAEGFDSGYEAGQKSEYDRFWDIYQDNGNRIEYDHAFGGKGWDDETFNPKYDLGKNRIERSYMMFARTGIKDLSKHCPSLEVVYNQYMFYQSNIVEHIGELRLDYGECYGTFSTCSDLKTIDKLVLLRNNTKFNATFNGCSSLENIVIEGVVSNDIDFTPCSKLTKASITSILNALSSTVSDKTLTLSKKAVDTAFQELDKADDGSINWYMPGSESSEWAELIATKSNWTISLV